MKEKPTVWVILELSEDGDQPDIHIYRSKEDAIQCFESLLKEYEYEYTTIEDVLASDDPDLMVDSADEDWSELWYGNLYICEEVLN